MSDFEGHLATLLKEHVHEGLGPRRPAPPLRDETTPALATPNRRSRRLLPALAAACVAAVAAVALVVVRGNNGGPATPVPPTAGWQRIDLPTGGREIYGMRSVGFVDPLHGWVTGMLNPLATGLVRFVIWTTSDGGRTWTLHVPLQSVPASITAAAFGDRTHGWLAKNGRDGVVIYATADGGETWTRQVSLTGGDGLGLVAVDAKHAWVYGNLGFLAATSDGATWTQLSTPENTYPRALRFVDPLHGWLIERTGHAYLTADGGRTWTPVPDPGGVGAGPRALDFVSPDVGWAVSANGGLYATSDGGRTWQRQPNAPDRLSRLAFADSRYGWVFGRGGDFRTSNGGRTWTRDDVPSSRMIDAAAARCNTLVVTTFTALRNGGCH